MNLDTSEIFTNIQLIGIPLKLKLRNKDMNFLFILNTFYPNIGGVENATYEICKRLKERGHEIFVLTTTKVNVRPNNQDLPFFEKIDGIRIYRIRHALRFFDIPWKALYLARKYQIDYVYITDFWGGVALFLKKIFRIPFVYVLNGYNPICPRGTLFHEQACQGFEVWKCLEQCHKFSFRFLFTLIITRMLLLEAEPVIAISEAVRDAYRAYFGKISMKLLYYGVDAQKFKPLPVQPSTLTHNLEDSDKILLFFGRLIKERGVAEFLPHFKEILKQVECKLLIVGSGPEIKEIKEEANSLSLQKKVIFTGFLRNKDLVNVINISTLVILPILFPEPLSLVALEAMACGKPVISFELGGVKELLAHDKVGLLIAPNNWKEFTNKIHQILSNEELSESIGSAARQRVEKFFTWKKFVDQFLKVIIQNR